MEKEYFKQYYYFERNHWWFSARLKILNDYIDKNISNLSSLRILNIGAATGATSEMLNLKGSLISIEYDKECINFLKTKIPLKVQWGDITALDFEDNYFDLVCAFDVLEHVEDDSLAFAEMTRVCKVNGHVLVTVPANMGLWSEHDIINHHYRRYTVDNLLLSKNKSEVLKVKYISYFNYYLFYPIYLVRRIKLIIFGIEKDPGNTKSDFEAFKFPFMNKILYIIFSLEKLKIKNQKTFRRGVSIIAHFIKK